jgi:hypothetical protein
MNQFEKISSLYQFFLYPIQVNKEFIHKVAIKHHSLTVKLREYH